MENKNIKKYYSDSEEDSDSSSEDEIKDGKDIKK
jgi:hypothetical protein